MIPSGETHPIALAVLQKLRSVAPAHGYLNPLQVEICVIRVIRGYD